MTKDKLISYLKAHKRGLENIQKQLENNDIAKAQLKFTIWRNDFKKFLEKEIPSQSGQTQFYPLEDIVNMSDINSAEEWIYNLIISVENNEILPRENS